MTDTTVVLDDDDFDDAPPGYRSQQAKERYVPLMATLLGGTFILQFIVPFLIMMIGIPMMAMQQFTKGMPQYSKAVAWQGDLWYPKFAAPGGRGGCTLSAMDYRGKSLDRPPLELDMQPDWFVADGERLWAVSKNEVAEVFADGSRPVMMRPTRYLLHPCPPILSGGKLSIIDYDEGNRWSLYQFERGEWVRSAALAIPDFAPASRESAASDAPADALPADSAKQPPVNNTPAPQDQNAVGLPTASNLARNVEQVRIISPGGTSQVLFRQNKRIFHHSGLPVDEEADAESNRANWTAINPQRNSGSLTDADWTVTAVEGAPAVIMHDSQRNQEQTQLWLFREGKWGLAAESDAFEGGPGSTIRAVVTEDGSRTFVVHEIMNGLSNDLWELKPGGLTKVANLSSMPFADPFSLTGGQLWLQVASQGSTFTLMLIMLLGSTWLMSRYRDPNFYKGRVPVAYASLFQRAIAVVVDALVFNIPVTIVWYFWYVAQDQTYFQLVESLVDDPQAFFPKLKFPLFFSLAWLSGGTLIYWLMLAWGGFSPGKLLCGVRVARTNLDPPGILRALIRILVGIAETMFGIIIPVALIAFLQDRQRLGDLVAGTVVVRSGSLRAGRRQLAAAAEARAEVNGDEPVDW